MNSSALLATKAYGAALNTPTIAKGPETDNGLSFGNMLAEQVSNTVQASRNAEQEASKAAVGKGDLVNVVTAISAAETQLETMIAFRDQAIQAYQEITRMAI